MLGNLHLAICLSAMGVGWPEARASLSSLAIAEIVLLPVLKVTLSQVSEAGRKSASLQAIHDGLEHRAVL